MVLVWIWIQGLQSGFVYSVSKCFPYWREALAKGHLLAAVCSKTSVPWGIFPLFSPSIYVVCTAQKNPAAPSVTVFPLWVHQCCVQGRGCYRTTWETFFPHSVEKTPHYNRSWLYVTCLLSMEILRSMLSYSTLKILSSEAPVVLIIRVSCPFVKRGTVN